ncbi:ComEC/Rec2 family competence protein [Ruminococcaceae bacterium OttesenSCG-928-I18]|nr:ComEC/Rec2 family competence protein [Ruminococcaceae bacterium OttesenSCG-928-I18]
MKRPLAAFGFCFLLTLLAASKLPAGFLFPCTVVLALLAVFCLLFFRRGAKAYLPLLLVSAAVALLFRTGYEEVFVKPALALDGQTRPVVARVEDTQPGFGDDLVTANLALLSIDGEKLAVPTKVRVGNLPEVQIGDLIQTELRFYDYSGRDSAAFNYSKGFYIGASPASSLEMLGQEMTFLCAMRSLRYNAGDNIHTRLPLRLASVAAAMSVGDKRALAEDTIQAYRMAGISHMLVVSGLHLSILSGAVYTAARALSSRRRFVSVFCMAAVFLFMVFTGLTPSIVRSGVACLLVYVAVLFYRKADVYTSLGLAALLLCLQNPYAAADAGLQLSFTATLGALTASDATQRLKRRQNEKNPTRLRRMVQTTGRSALVSGAITLYTLPVIALNGFGVSLFSVPVNLIAVPLLSPIVLCGFVMALPGGFFLVDFFARTAALVAGVLLVVLEKITQFCALFPQMYLTLGGLFFFLAILLCYLLVYLAFKTRWKKAYLAAAVLFLPLALVLHLALDRDTVRITLLGSGNNASLLVTQNRQALVLYRSRLSATGVQRAFGRQNIEDCALFVDFRQTAQSTEYESLFTPEQVYFADRDLVSREVFQPLKDVSLYLQAQGEGRIACVDVHGYKVALILGAVDLSAYTAVDVLIPAAGTVTGEYNYVLTAGQPPDWAAPRQGFYTSGGSAQLLLRPGKSVVFREADHDIIL